MNIFDSISVQADLKRRGWTQSALARSIGVGAAIVSKTINGRERSERIEMAVEQIINWNPWEGIQVTRRGRRKGKDAGTADK